MTMATANTERGIAPERTTTLPDDPEPPPRGPPRAEAHPAGCELLADLDDAPVPIHCVRPDGTILWANRAELALLGYPAQEYVGRSIAELHADPAVAAEVLERLARGGLIHNLEVRLRAKDGSLCYVLLSAKPKPQDAYVHCFTRDITERKRRETERVQRAHAEEATRLRDEFLALASHELRTPLTVLQLQLEALRARVDATDHATLAKLGRSNRACARLAELVDALLDVSRIATGRFELSLARGDAAEIARTAVDRLSEAAEAAGCAMTLATEPALGTWDRSRLDQVISNLVSNAIRHAAGSEIAVSVRRDGDAALIEVRDHGPGLPEDQLARLFERFERGASMRHFGGLGLGLYFVRQVIEAHGGSVSARNADDGGACVAVRLPCEGATGLGGGSVGG